MTRRRPISVLSPVAGIARRAGIDGEDVTIPAPGRSVADVILQEAARWHADLIVVGSHGRQGVARLLFGSISETLAGAADIPVLVVRQPVLGMLTG
jgi:nucleotide-binding universal stress UspA family protein